MASDLNVSLEPHLRDSLTAIQPVVPAELGSKLKDCLPSEHVTISYELLRSISQWARTPEALETLRTKDIDPNSYTMVALLAGTKTSPERKFGHYERPPEPEDVVARDLSERKAIATLVNAVLSVGGSGAAAWWGSVHTGWAVEWRALFSLIVAIVVAVSEAVLYLIWTSDFATKSSKLARPRRENEGRKKDETTQETIEPSMVSTTATTDSKPLRRRGKEKE